MIFGGILIISGILNDQGKSTIWMVHTPILREIASIIQQPGQQFSYQPETLIGTFAGFDPLILFIMGVIFIISGFVLTLLIYLKNENIKFSNITSKLSN